MLYRFAAWAHHAMPGKESLSTTFHGRWCLAIRPRNLYYPANIQHKNEIIWWYDVVITFAEEIREHLHFPVIYRPFWNDTPHNLRGLKRPNMLPKSLRFCASSGRCFCTFGTAEAGYSALCGANFSPDLSKVSGKCWEDFCTHPREIHRNPIFPKFSNIKIQKVFAFFYTCTLMCRAYWRLSASFLLACPCQLCSFNHKKRLSFWPRSRGSPTCRSCVFVFFGLPYCAYDFRCLLTRWE